MASIERISLPNRTSLEPANSMPTTAAVEETPPATPTASQGTSLPRVLPQHAVKKTCSTVKVQPPPQNGETDLQRASVVHPANRASEQPKQEENLRFSGIPEYQGHSYADRLYDYTRKHPPNAEGKELDADARVWKVYLDECESYDNDMVKGFRDTIDSLLVFAALFSSVVTGFVVQVSQALEPDYAQIGANLLFEQIEVLRAAGNVTRIQEIPRSPLTPDSITHSSLDVAINWMFFTSLAFSLATAFLAVLIKQWLQAFTALVPGDAKVRSLTRQFRFGGLQKWKLSEIINILPLFLHLALAFFLIGLCLFVSHFHPSIIVMIGVVTCASIAFYIITSALPAVQLDCPYRLPILYFPMCLALYVSQMTRFKITKLLQKGRLREYGSQHALRRSLSLPSLYSQEQHYIAQTSQHLEGASLAWLFSQTTNVSVQRIALHGVCQYLKGDIFDALRFPWLSSGRPKKAAMTLRDLLPLESMSLAAIRFSAQLLRPDAQVKDARLLRDVVHAIDSPYGPDFVDAEVFPVNATFQYYQSDFTGSPLDHACRLGKWNTAIALLKRSPDSDLTRQDEHGMTPLGRASCSHDISHEDWVTIFSLTQAQGIDLNTFHCTRNRHTVLHLICLHGTMAAVHHLISHIPNLDLNVDCSSGRTPLHYVCQRLAGPLDDMNIMVSFVQNLVAHGGDVRRQDVWGRTPLHVACGWMDLFRAKGFISPVVRELLAAGADPNIWDRKRRLPLHLACDSFVSLGCSEAGLRVIQEILPVTANVNVLSREAFTPPRTPLDSLENWSVKGKGNWAAAYSLMRRYGARLAKEITQIDEQEGCQRSTATVLPTV